MEKTEEVIIIGAGPCGLACALALQKYGINPLIIEKGNIVQTIQDFPTHQTFFSTSDRLEIGDIPFISPNAKPVRLEALAYYREVATRKALRIQPYEEVTSVVSDNDYVFLKTNRHAEHQYKAKDIIIATGYYNQPQKLNIEGESLSKVSHYFKEAHPYYRTNVAVIGGKNSAVDAALALHQAGAKVTVFYRGDAYSKSIKPWILPQFDALVQKNEIDMKFNTQVNKIEARTITYEENNQEKVMENDFVFAMTGYEPNISFLQTCGIKVDPHSGRPEKNEVTFETNLPNVYVAGVIISGFNGNETFIENGRLHGDRIAKAIADKRQIK